MIKRGQSQIVSTVLLILLVITAIVLVFSFVIPFVKDKLSSGDCLDVAGKIEISTGYTCYNVDKMQVQVHVGDIRDLIKGFSIEFGGKSSDIFKVDNETSYINAAICDGTIGDDLILPPKDNTERTYVFSGITEKPDVIRVYPILNSGKTCDISDSITVIDDCFGNICSIN